MNRSTFAALCFGFFCLGLGIGVRLQPEPDVQRIVIEKHTHVDFTVQPPKKPILPNPINSVDPKAFAMMLKDEAEAEK